MRALTRQVAERYFILGICLFLWSCEGREKPDKAIDLSCSPSEDGTERKKNEAGECVEVEKEDCKETEKLLNSYCEIDEARAFCAESAKIYDKNGDKCREALESECDFSGYAWKDGECQKEESTVEEEKVTALVGLFAVTEKDSSKKKLAVQVTQDDTEITDVDVEWRSEYLNYSEASTTPLALDVFVTFKIADEKSCELEEKPLKLKISNNYEDNEQITFVCK